MHHLAFSNSTDLFLAEILLFNVGVLVERQFGSVKYAVSYCLQLTGFQLTPKDQSFAIITVLLGTIVEFVSLILFHRFGLNHIAMGPSVLIFSIVYQYSRIVPAAYNFRIFGIPLSNKNVPHLLALQVCIALPLPTFDINRSFQLAISRLPGSAAVAMIGILTGQLYRSDLANLRSYRLPPSVIEITTRFILPLVGSARPPHRSNRAIPDERLASHGTNEARPPNDEVITTTRTPPASTARARFDLDPPDGPRGTSVVRQWVDELSGRVERESAVRIATEEQINTMTTMFPHVPREIIINALQEK